MIYNKVIPLEKGFKLEIKPAEIIDNFHATGVLSTMLTEYLKHNYDVIDFRETIGHIFNELIENATKYCDKKEAISLFAFEENNGTIVFEVKNYTNEYNYNVYRSYVDFLNSKKSTPHEKYLNLVYSNINKTGGIGIIKLIVDFNLQFEFSFETFNDKFLVTTKCEINTKEIFNGR